MKKPVQVFHPRRLNELIASHDLVAAIRLARNLRGEGYRGAVWYEFLAAIAHRTPWGYAYAGEVGASIRPAELYDDVPISLPVDFPLAARLASWILHHDWRVRDSTFNPGHRLQMLLSAYENETSATSVGKALLAEKAIEKGEIVTAFRFLLPSIADSGSESWIRRVALLLFRSIPRRQIRDVLVYQDGGARSFGIAPVKNEGYVFTEYTGTVLDRPLFFNRTAPRIPIVQIIDGAKPSVDDLLSVLAENACGACPALADLSFKLTKKAA